MVAAVAGAEADIFGGGFWKGNGRGRTGGGAMTGRPTQNSGTNNHEGSLIDLRHRRMRVNWGKIRPLYTQSVAPRHVFTRGCVHRFNIGSVPQGRYCSPIEVLHAYV